MPLKPDLIILGGGLTSSLVFWRLKKAKPQFKIWLVTEDSRLLAQGGLVVFSAAQLPENTMKWLGPLVSVEWPKEETTDLFALMPNDVDLEIRKTHIGDVLLNTDIKSVENQKLVLKDDKSIEAGVVLDGRSFKKARPFFAMQMRLAKAHDLKAPLLGEAVDVGALDFIPLEENEVWVQLALGDAQDQTPDDTCREVIMNGILRHGWRVEKTLSERKGVLEPLAEALALAEALVELKYLGEGARRLFAQKSVISD